MRDLIRRGVLLFVLGITTVAASAGESVSASPGIVVPIGGALRYNNDEVWSRLVELAGGKGARFAVLPTAAGNPQRSGRLTAEALTARGAQVDVLPVSARWPDTDLAAVVEDPALAARVERAQGVMFTGGAQERIVDALAPGGKETRLLRAIRGVLTRGGVVAGTSAGAAVMSSVMFRDAQDSHAILKGRMTDGKEVDRGLGFVGNELFIDQHFLRRGRIGRMLPLMHAKGYRLGLGIEENSAAIIANGKIEVIGAKGALLVDLTDAQHDKKNAAFTISNARLSYLDRGDRYDLATRRGQPSANKAMDLRLRPDQPGAHFEYPQEVFYMDILADNVIANAMGRLMDSPLPKVSGLAFNARPAADDMRPDLGFEFTLSRDERTEGWFTGSFGGEDYTIFDMRLDVRPVKISTPLYAPWSN